MQDGNQFANRSADAFRDRQRHSHPGKPPCRRAPQARQHQAHCWTSAVRRSRRFDWPRPGPRQRRQEREKKRQTDFAVSQEGLKERNNIRFCGLRVFVTYEFRPLPSTSLSSLFLHDTRTATQGGNSCKVEKPRCFLPERRWRPTADDWLPLNRERSSEAIPHVQALER